MSGAETALHRQCAALCWRRQKGGEVEILLVTSRETGRWVIPKGWPVKGLSESGSAAQEAFEEAGVEGRLTPAALGTYAYGKVLDRSVKIEIALPCQVSVFALEVLKTREKFPERDERRRKWFTRERAADRVDEPELKSLISGFDPGALAEKGAGAAAS